MVAFWERAALPPSLATSLAVALLLALLAAALVREWRQRHILQQRLAACEARQQDLVRVARMTASDLRGPALSLLGHAEHAPEPLKATLTGLCRYLLDLGEALLDHTEDQAAQRHLREEEVALGPLLDFVIAQVAAQLGPGRRAWRVAPGMDQVVLRADRRALHQVLLRVLTGAALATEDGDGIDIAGVTEAAFWSVRIEDEGTGLAVGRVESAGVESRGLGLGLALARSLMQAHGGGLSLESTSLVGTRALLSFPRERVLVGL